MTIHCIHAAWIPHLSAWPISESLMMRDGKSMRPSVLADCNMLAGYNKWTNDSCNYIYKLYYIHIHIGSNSSIHLSIYLSIYLWNYICMYVDTYIIALYSGLAGQDLLQHVAFSNGKDLVWRTLEDQHPGVILILNPTSYPISESSDSPVGRLKKKTLSRVQIDPSDILRSKLQVVEFAVGKGEHWAAVVRAEAFFDDASAERWSFFVSWLEMECLFSALNAKSRSGLTCQTHHLLLGGVGGVPTRKIWVSFPLSNWCARLWLKPAWRASFTKKIHCQSVGMMKCPMWKNQQC